MNESSNPREIDALKSWVRSVQAHLQDELCFDSLSSDASLRRYFRVNCEQTTQMAVYSPPDSQKNDAFLHIRQVLAAQQVAVPEMFGFERQQGFMLQQDLGDQQLLDVLTAQTAERWYQKAVAILMKFAAFNHHQVSPIDCYDEPLFKREFTVFEGEFLCRWLGITLDTAQKSLMEATFRYLMTQALSQPQVFTHRDFHSRNLMIQNDQLVVIDFQDAVMGPVTYDAVSLFKDCYIDWPEEQVERWVADYYARLVNVDAVDTYAFSLPEFIKNFHLMGLQRHLKVLGIFSRLALNENRQDFLPYMPRVMAYVLSAVQTDPQLADFSEFMHSIVLPRFKEKQGCLL